MKKIIVFLLSICALVACAPKKSEEPVNMLVKFTVKAAKTEQFMKAAIQSVNGSREEPGNLEMKIYTDKNNPAVFYVYSRWKNNTALVQHQQQAYTLALQEVAQSALASEPEIFMLGETSPAPEVHTMNANARDEDETLFFIFKIKDGYRDQVLKQFEKHVTNTHKEEGNIWFDFYTVEGDDNTFVVYENWKNAAAIWDVHMKQPYSEETGALLQEAIVGTLEEGMNFVDDMEVPLGKIEVETKWEVSGLSQPESVLSIPGHEWIYVSNVNGEDADGFISRLSKDGQIDQLKWVDGIHTPTGMGFFNGCIYVADQTRVCVIDLAKGEIVKTLPSEAKTLNDISISKEGQVFISDLTTGRIFTVEDDKVVVWVETDLFTTPNGVLVQDGSLIVGSVGTILSRDLKPEQYGSLYKINLADKNIQMMASTSKLGTFDGIVEYCGGLLASSPMTGQLFYVKDAQHAVVVELLPGIADIGMDCDSPVIYAPFLFGNKIVAYDLINQPTKR